MDQVDVLIFDTIFWDEEFTSSNFQTLLFEGRKYDWSVYYAQSKIGYILLFHVQNDLSSSSQDLQNYSSYIVKMLKII